GRRWWLLVHPDDRPEAERRWQREAERGGTYEVSSRLRRAADGTYRWHLVRAVPFRAEDGGIRKWYGTSTDMHDLKRAEEQRRLLTDASAILGGSLEYEQALERVAGLAVHELADWCVFGVLE